MAGPKPLHTRIRRKFEREGVTALLRSLPSESYSLARSYVYSSIAAILFDRIDSNVLGRDDLEVNIDDREVWSYRGHERCEIQFDGPVESLPDPFRSCIGEFHWPPARLFQIREATLLWDGSPALSASNEVVLETAENDPAILRQRIAHALDKRGLRRVLSDLSGRADALPSAPSPLFLLVRHPTTNYYHWITEYLPKLAAFEEYVSHVEEQPTLMIERDPPGWVTESLEAMGYGPDRRLSWRGDAARISRLLVPQHRSRTPDTPELPPPTDCEYVRRSIVDVSTDNAFANRVFISRRQANDRRVRNIREVRTVLDEYGFTSYTLENMTFSEQVDLFSGASIILGCHGAGLTNLLFSNDATVVELLPTSDVRNHYFYLSMVRGLDYEYVLTETFGTDIVVDPSKLRTILDRIT